MTDTIEELEAVLGEVDAEVRQCQEKLQILQQEKFGLQAALRRLRDRKVTDEKGRQATRGVAVPRQGLVQLSEALKGFMDSIDANAGRAEQIQLILDQARAPLALGQIEALANQTGEKWTSEQVRSAVAALNKKNLVRNVGRGVWVSAKTSAGTAATVPAESVPTTRSEGGSQGVEPPTPVLGEDHGPFGGREASDLDRETGNRDVVIQ